MRRKKNRGVNALLFIAIIALVGFVAATVVLQPFSIDTSVKNGDFISVPTYGFIKCEKSQNLITAPPTGFETFSHKTITCQQFGSLLQECDVTLKTPPESAVSSLKIKNAWLMYSVCTIGTQCRIYKGDIANNHATVKSYFNVNEGNTDREFKVHLGPNEFLYAEYQEAGVIDKVEVVGGKAGFKVSYEPYELRRYDVFSQSNGAMVSNSEDCTIKGDVDELNFIIEDVRGGGELSSKLKESDLLNKNNLRSRGATMTYISNFVGIVPQFDLFEDNTLYCYDKNIYRVEEIETPSGVYKVANTGTNKEVRSVDCCNDGDVPAGYYCSNFKMEKLSSSDGGQCSVLNPCPIVGFMAVAGKKVASQECVNNKCVTDYKAVECNFHEECPGGYCDVNKADPSKNKCVTHEPQEFCGNGVCEASKGESLQSCPDDCDSGKVDDNFLWYIIIGVLVLVVLMLAVKAKMGRR